MSDKNKRQRLSREDRRSMLLDRAAELFAEDGFGVSTHRLAEAMGVTQPLIYSYFSSKDDLLEAVYDRVLDGHFKALWTEIISDRGLPLPDRLVSFYRTYAETTQNRQWLRLYLYSGLKSRELNFRYIRLLEHHVINVIAREVRHALGLPDPESHPIGKEELEVVWNTHTGLFYNGIRRVVFELDGMADFNRSTAKVISVFLAGYPALFPDAESGRGDR